MKAIILAAGRGTRLQPLTNTIPKPMIQICGKPILEFLMESLYLEVSEIILVVKYKEEIIKEYF
jgi:NDP-sugar pyrophosphorylase family protein